MKAPRQADLVVAVPLFGEDVAPRFCYASEVLVARVESGQVCSRRRLAMDGLPWPERIRVLAGLHVELILAGGFDRRVLPMAAGCGIEVLWGLTGDAEQILDALCRGKLPTGQKEAG